VQHQDQVEQEVDREQEESRKKPAGERRSSGRRSTKSPELHDQRHKQKVKALKGAERSRELELARRRKEKEFRCQVGEEKVLQGTRNTEEGDTSDLVLDCGGRVVGFTKSFVLIGSLLQRMSVLQDTLMAERSTAKTLPAYTLCFSCSELSRRSRRNSRGKHQTL
jgi:hypothetical protein